MSTSTYTVSESTTIPIQSHALVSTAGLETTSLAPSATNGGSLKAANINVNADTDFDTEQLEDDSQQQPSKNNCDRHRSEQEINQFLKRIPIASSVTAIDLIQNVDVLPTSPRWALFKV